MDRTSFSAAAVVALALAVAAPAAATDYAIDPAHTTVGFKVRHMMVSKVAGRFGGVAGEFSYDGKDPKGWKTSALIKVASIDTGVPDRDDHLRSADFFDSEKHPTIAFTSTGVRDWKEGKGKLLGEFTMKGVSKPVTLDLELVGEAVDPKGNKRAGFTATGKINRQDFGVSWSKTLDGGGLMVGDDVEITLEVEGIEKKPAPRK